MNTETEIKKYSLVYDTLQDLKEYALAEVIEFKLLRMGYKVVILRQKYAFKFVGVEQ